MPLDRWNESVYRYYFCRSVAKTNPEVKQYIECNRIDLVLDLGAHRAFLEFKFYSHPPRFNPNDLKPHGYKGGLSKKNIEEFRDSIKKLNERNPDKHLLKYLVLVYWDFDETPLERKYDHFYEKYTLSKNDVVVKQVEPYEFSTELLDRKVQVKARLYKITTAQKRDTQNNQTR